MLLDERGGRLLDGLAGPFPRPQGGPADGLAVTITWSRLRYGWHARARHRRRDDDMTSDAGHTPRKAQVSVIA